MAPRIALAPHPGRRMAVYVRYPGGAVEVGVYRVSKTGQARPTGEPVPHDMPVQSAECLRRRHDGSPRFDVLLEARKRRKFTPPIGKPPVWRHMLQDFAGKAVIRRQA